MTDVLMGRSIPDHKFRVPTYATAEPVVLISEPEAAAMLGVATITLRNWRRTSQPVPRWVKLGSLIRYKREDVMSFIDLRMSEEV